MTRDDLLTFFLPILITALVTAFFALSATDKMTAFWRGLIGCIVLLTGYFFIKALVDTANDPNAREGDLVASGFQGFFLGLLLGGLVGLGVGYAARAVLGQKRKY